MRFQNCYWLSGKREFQSLNRSQRADFRISSCIWVLNLKSGVYSCNTVEDCAGYAVTLSMGERVPWSYCWEMKGPLERCSGSGLWMISLVSGCSLAPLFYLWVTWLLIRPGKVSSVSALKEPPKRDTESQWCLNTANCFIILQQKKQGVGKIFYVFKWNLQGWIYLIINIVNLVMLCNIITIKNNSVLFEYIFKM